jgi:S1-C subfamily serine protease
VVRIDNSGRGIGSGVIVRQDGYIVTNYHVVAHPSQLAVTLANGRTLPARLVGGDPVDDLASVKVEARNLPAATFADSSKLKVGQSVLAIGNPLGISSTVTEGIISALNRTVSEGPGGGSILNAVQTSAAINPGNSGGALVDLSGRVIGIPTLTAVDPTFGAPTNGVGFAIPSNTVERIVPQIIEHGKVLHSNRAGLGIFSETVTPELASRYGLAADHGALVARVNPGSPAEKSDIRMGDVIVKLDETEVATTSDLVEALAHKKPGDTAKVTLIDRQGQSMARNVVLGELPVNDLG